jgi:hypothetical protein
MRSTYQSKAMPCNQVTGRGGARGGVQTEEKLQPVQTSGQRREFRRGSDHNVNLQPKQKQRRVW